MDKSQFDRLNRRRAAIRIASGALALLPILREESRSSTC